MKVRAIVALLLGAAAAASAAPRVLREMNPPPAPGAGRTVAIVGARVIDGRGGPAISEGTVLVRGDRIAAVGPRSSVAVSAEAQRIEGRGLSVLPGLIDSHFHLDGDEPLPALYLSHGVTSVRDPGAWIEAYEGVRKQTVPLPRLFLCGPHLDSPPPAYPKDAIIVRDAEEARLAVERAAEAGASAIKVYFRLPLALARAAAEAAHASGLPVTAHLEILDARDAIRAGIDGIEHVTSFGTALAPPQQAEVYRQAVLADNSARREGRYQVWSAIDLDSPRTREVLDLVGRRGTFLSPTLAVFERRAGDRNTTDVHVRGFEKMVRFVGLAHKAGARVVVGSHSSVPHAEKGWAYQREMELLVEAGLTPMEAIVAGTTQQARFFRVSERLGSLERGKLADLVLVEGRPDEDIRAMRNVRRVMLNGRWVR
jgi:imidazolonepropionase-like amidohydrolase